MTHRAERTIVVPSGWRVICTCGYEARGIDRAQALDRFHDHCENDHALFVEEVGQE